MEIDQVLQFKLRERVQYIDKVARKIYDAIFEQEELRGPGIKRRMHELYQSLKVMMDTAQEVMLKTVKKEMKGGQIGELCRAINYDKIRSSLKRKLIKRVNCNPRLIDQIDCRVEQICAGIDTVSLQARFSTQKSEVGNCMYTDRNFATALRNHDCIGVLFQLERPDSAIADPGRVRIRQVSPMVSTVNKFFEVHLNKIVTPFHQLRHKQKASLFHRILKIGLPSLTLFPSFQGMGQQEVEHCIRQRVETDPHQLVEELGIGLDHPFEFGIDPAAYQQRWDYWNKAERRKGVVGILPLYVCEENWEVGKLLMKLCMGWNCCGDPAGYCFAQSETLPFMVLSAFIKAIQEAEYAIEELRDTLKTLTKQPQIYQLRHTINQQKSIVERYENLLKHVQRTCQAIMADMSHPKCEEKLSDKIIKKYTGYQQALNRTIDIINNNSSFIGQVYTAIKLGFMGRPSQQQFHEFFKRLVEEELRRQTERWNEDQAVRRIQSEEEMEDAFINKLLNAHTERMDKPEYVVVDSVYRDRFRSALEGHEVVRTELEVLRQDLAMMVKEGGTFNETQRMMLIEYKRLYENRVMWLWYVRFRLFGSIERRKIHKWRCLDLNNSYMLFTMIIQNKKQRRNHRRREAILQRKYVDPFDYPAARVYLEHQYLLLRTKKEALNIVMLNSERFTKAARVFAMTPDLDEAAGALLNCYVGRGEIMTFFYELKRDGRVVEEKMKMLLKGKHKALPLIKEGWMMSRKKMNQMRARYPLIFSRYQYMF